jgi:hypothetical protein
VGAQAASGIPPDPADARSFLPFTKIHRLKQQKLGFTMKPASYTLGPISQLQMVVPCWLAVLVLIGQPYMAHQLPRQTFYLLSHLKQPRIELLSLLQARTRFVFYSRLFIPPLKLLHF